ncbi:MAG: bdlA 4 [Massilia sp.]|nr:bdlA 4 [Massilia sp.]
MDTYTSDAVPRNRADSRMAEAVLHAINQSQSLVEFDLAGKVLHANDNFLRTMGYTLDELKGVHHRQFCTPEFAASNEYRDLWARLKAGHADGGETMHVAKNGATVWLQASYNPIAGDDGAPFKVVTVASDISAAKLRNANLEGTLQAVERVQASIEFDLSGRILHANDNFLKVVGYGLDEVVGQHHRMFCTTEFAHSAEYQLFWTG